MTRQASDPSTPAASSTPNCFCRKCGYALVGLESKNCPECGREFDATNPLTFATRPPRTWTRRLAKISLVLFLTAGLPMAWLWWGWQSEQHSVEKLRWDFASTIVFKKTGPAGLDRLLGSKFGYLQDRVEKVLFNNRPATEIQSMNLKSLPYLQTLTFLGGRFDDNILTSIGEIATLQELNLLNADVFKPNIAFLAKLPRLKKLDLCGVWIDDPALVHVAGLKELNTLGLNKSLITDDGLKQLEGLTHLVELDLSSTRITDAGLEHLKNLKSLRILNVSSTWVTPDGSARLKQAIPGLVIK